ncbi:Pre-rrna-processing protein esf2, partial [Globisporangium splendens]
MAGEIATAAAPEEAPPAVDVKAEDASAKKPAKRSKLDLSREKMEQFKKKAEKRGVVYISRVPPFMKPEKVKHLLDQYGDINRIYLVPEDKTHHKKRVAAGGNRKQSYTEGWIEFEDKKVAKQVAKVLNTRQIGGRKRDYYHDDIWNLKYLKGFKWDHLTEKIAYENRIRDQKLRMEIAQAKKENEAYLEKVEQSKKFEKMEERKSGAGANGGTNDRDAQHQQIRRTFQQKAPTSSKQHSSLGSSDTLLEKVFASAHKKRKVSDE